MTYVRFKPDDEVTVIRESLSDATKYIHLTVSRLGSRDALVVLSDGSRWRQSGREWGSKRWSRFDPILRDRKTGLEHEAQNAPENARREWWELWHAAIRKLDHAASREDVDRQALRVLIDLAGEG